MDGEIQASRTDDINGALAQGAALLVQHRQQRVLQHLVLLHRHQAAVLAQQLLGHLQAVALDTVVLRRRPKGLGLGSGSGSGLEFVQSQLAVIRYVSELTGRYSQLNGACNQQAQCHRVRPESVGLVVNHGGLATVMVQAQDCIGLLSPWTAVR